MINFEKIFLDRGCGSNFEVNDDNFKDISKDIDDSLGSLLANAGIAIAEQKKLLQNAKSPLALQNAIKLLALTGGNLLHASTSMLSWMGKQLNKPYGSQHDSIDENEIYDGELFNELKKFATSLSGGIRKLFVKAIGDAEDEVNYDSCFKDEKIFTPKDAPNEVHYQTIEDGKDYSIIFRPSVGDFIIATGYNNVTGKWLSAEVGFSLFSKAMDALNVKLRK